jgi:hypothetical protein
MLAAEQLCIDCPKARTTAGEAPWQPSAMAHAIAARSAMVQASESSGIQQVLWGWLQVGVCGARRLADPVGRLEPGRGKEPAASCSQPPRIAVMH